MSRNLIECFSSVTDPRITNISKHKLIDIIVIAVCGTICNCDTFIDIEEYGKTKIEWFKLFLDLPGGIPSFVNPAFIK